MKKLLALSLSTVMLLSLAACGSSATTTTTETTTQESTTEESKPETISLTTRDGNSETVTIEFPYDPQRLAVLDLGALDILDNIGYGDRVVGVPKSSSIEYLNQYLDGEEYANLGTVKEADLEALMASEPDVIFIGGRLASMYDELSAIAPVYMIYTDSTIGVVESTSFHATNLASLFGAESVVADLLSAYNARIEALQAVAADKTAIIGLVTSGGFSLLGNDARCSIIGKEIGFENVGVDANVDTSTHGNEASFEYVLNANPDYIFVLDRDAAINTEGAQLAAEVMNNELVNKTTAAQNGNVIVMENPSIWYTAEGGITALGIMLGDLESALIQ